MTPEKQVLLGRKAELLINDTKDIFESIKLELIDAIIKAKVSDMDGVRDLKITIMLLDRLKSRIEQVVSDGKVAEYALMNENNTGVK